jgi:hypothetical protein
MEMKKIVAGTCTLAMTLSMTSIALADTKTATQGQTLTTDIQDVLTMTCLDASNEVANDHVVELGNLTPGTPVTGATVCTVLTNSDNGYTLNVKRDDATTTMEKDSDNAVDIEDLNGVTLWDGSTLGLGFTIDPVIVPTNTVAGSIGWANAGASYDGFTAGGTDILTTEDYVETAQDTQINYKLDVPSTQQSGTYSGTITYTVTTTS